MKPQHRHIVLTVALLASVGAAIWTEGENDSGDRLVAAVEKPRASDKTATLPEDKAGKGLIDQLQRDEVAVSDVDPFRAKSWYVAPPAPPPPPPPKPTAPPMPFKYMGMYEDQGRPVVYLTRGEDLFTVSLGEKFAESYQLEKIERGTLVITYLPLAIRQTLSIGINE